MKSTDDHINHPEVSAEEPQKRGVISPGHSRLEALAGEVLSGSILTRAEVRRQYPYVLFTVALMMLYIANGFHIQKLHRERAALTKNIKELRAQSLTVSALKMSATRQSEIIRELERRHIPLKESLAPPKVIKK